MITLHRSQDQVFRARKSSFVQAQHSTLLLCNLFQMKSVSSMSRELPDKRVDCVRARSRNLPAPILSAKKGALLCCCCPNQFYVRRSHLASQSGTRPNHSLGGCYVDFQPLKLGTCALISDGLLLKLLATDLIRDIVQFHANLHKNCIPVTLANGVYFLENR